MNRLQVSFLALGAFGLLVSGCASRPKPETTTVAEAAPPAAPTTQPTAPTTVAPPPAPTAPATSAPTGPTAGSIAEFQQSVGDRVYFDTDRWDLNAESQQALARQAQWLNTYRGVSILVSGNCDERGTREYNLALGSRRAEAVKNYLVSMGVAANRISTVSYGKERPIDPRPSEEGWAINRNAQTQLTGGAPSV